MGFDLSEITALKEFVPQAGREFHTLGYRPYLIAQMLQKGIAVETPEAHVAAGLDDRNLAAEAAIGDYTVEEVEAFVRTGMAQLRGLRDILRSGLSVKAALLGSSSALNLKSSSD